MNVFNTLKSSTLPLTQDAVINHDAGSGPDTGWHGILRRNWPPLPARLWHRGQQAQTLPEGFSLDQMRAEELPALIGMAANEGWNPGLADVETGWKVDPDAFIALRHGHELAGGGMIFSYGRQMGFMGLFLVHPNLRGVGLGKNLWHYRLQQLQRRLLPGATIGMNGVPAMIPFYERGGFRIAHWETRYQGIATGRMDASAIPVSALPTSQVEAYDQKHVAAPRLLFLRQWLSQPGSSALAILEDGVIVGYGVSRPAHTGYKLGPVFAKNPGIAHRLVSSLMSEIEGHTVQIELPQPNHQAVKLAHRFGLSAITECARMYRGPQPRIPLNRIYGVTSFSYG